MIHLCTFTHTGSFLNYSASMSASFNASSVRSSQKKPSHPIPTSAERILDAPSLVDDYCKYVYFSLMNDKNAHMYSCENLTLRGDFPHRLEHYRLG